MPLRGNQYHENGRLGYDAINRSRGEPVVVFLWCHGARELV